MKDNKKGKGRDKEREREETETVDHQDKKNVEIKCEEIETDRMNIWSTAKLKETQDINYK